MSANSDNLKRSHSEQLSDLESRLGSTFEDEAVLAEIHVAIKALLTNNGDSEAQIRAILQKRFEAGDLRPESFELVKKMLDRILTENISTMPADVEAAPQSDVSHVATQVIEDNVVTPAPKPKATPAPSTGIQTSDNQLQVGSVLRDRFLLQQRVLGGSMGTVYKALDRRLAEAADPNPYVAIKVLSPKLSRNGNALRALQSEAAKGRCLSHPNIVRFIDLDREDELYFIVMEWLEGKSLSTILDDSSSKNIDLKTTLDIVKQVGRALDYAHQRGVIHADIKPGNIMITPSGTVKLFDFGVARVRQKEQEGKPDFDAAELSAKTPAYSSMQVLTGETPVAADDVFSLGCLMYRLVAGYRVFGPRNAAEAAAAGMEPQKPQGLNDGQWQALKKALAYSRVPRFASPAAFVAALDAKSGTSGESQPTPMVADEPLAVDDYDDEPTRSPWRLAVLGVILIGAVAVVMQTDIIERLEEFIAAVSTSTDPIPDASGNTPPPVEAPATVAEDAEESQAASDEVAVTDQEPGVLVEDFVAEETPQETAVEAAPAEEEIEEPEIDFASLLPPTLTVGLAATGQFVSEVGLTLREDGEPATVDLVRMNNILESYSVKLEEVGFSGNRSPWEAGQYEIADDGLVTFKAGQSRARTTISMPSDPLREPDRNVTIQVLEIDNAGSELAIIKLNLEDDDQRVFEAGLPQDTIGFAVSQISVREGDPAAQIDVVRFKPGNTSIEVQYVSRDVTATAEEDYFPPDYSVISFQPGQRSARLFIPLGQDSEVETDEAFMLELVSSSSETVPDIYQRIAVMIRDDD